MVKDVIIANFGSVNAFADKMVKEYAGELPLSRGYLYKLIDHEVVNPGIKSLNILADMTGVSKEEIYKEYSE